MPNWTFNKIRFRADAETIKKMMSDATPKEDGKLYFSSWIPTPETFLKYDTTNHPNGEGLKVGEKVWGWEEENDFNNPIVTEEIIEEFKKATEEQRKLYGVVGWYDYNVRTFGCKWDCDLIVEREIETEVEMSCETPWSAPYAFLLTMTIKYPELTICLYAEYEEGEWEEVYFEDGQMSVEATGTCDWCEEEEEEETDEVEE